MPADDNRLRDVCTSCGLVHYENPKMVLGTLPVWEGRVLLCRRAIEPRYGLWTLPAGFMELGESTEEGALRETQEEAGAQVQLGPLFSVFDVVQANQVHLFFLADMVSPALDPGPETLEARLFEEDEVPWDTLAFRSVRGTLARYFADRRAGRFGVHTQILR
ncbi:MAG: NUDIX domain-containing protein [Burkholderiaceae bacterium]